MALEASGKCLAGGGGSFTTLAGDYGLGTFDVDKAHRFEGGRCHGSLTVLMQNEA